MGMKVYFVICTLERVVKFSNVVKKGYMALIIIARIRIPLIIILFTQVQKKIIIMENN